MLRSSLAGILIVLCSSGCGGFTLAPGDHYHCNEALVESLGELQKAVVEAKVSCKLAESVSASHGDSEDVQ